MAGVHRRGVRLPAVARVLREGGYEGGDAMLYYGRPGPFADTVEATVMGGVDGLMAATGAGSTSSRGRPATSPARSCPAAGVGVYSAGAAPARRVSSSPFGSIAQGSDAMPQSASRLRIGSHDGGFRSARFHQEQERP